ncbi:hypothetical protein MHU86_8895 [Fragilaria crotonensis]|nr:hypothetical protein MHU86_8895 [Fragilaria crotonensis]
MIAFRRSMKIKVNNESGDNVADAISKFEEVQAPKWFASKTLSFEQVWNSILQNIEAGDWKEPTPIQMQAIPSLLERRDVMASAPTGSGKSGAFCIPALLLSAASAEDFYAVPQDKATKKRRKESRLGEIRSLLLAPSRELAHQLHREVERLGRNRPGGLTTLLLQRSNASQLGQAGGQKGLDVLVSTPLRLVDVLEQTSIKLDALRLVVLDEADRLLDATDLKGKASGSSHTKTFVSQLDSILNVIPPTAVRALFSATITPGVKELSDSILRNACQITIQSFKVGGANTDIAQELLFCGREEGKLLAIRQLVARDQLHPPTLIFCQSQERAQALFSELLYDNLHVDVLHAGRSPAARETAVKNFRTGHTWVLICTDLVARGVDFYGVKLVINYDLPTSGVTYVHRIGRTGRAGRKGKAITFFTEADLEHLRTIANIMKQSGCDVPQWMLQLKKVRAADGALPRRLDIDTTPRYDTMKRHRKQQIIDHNKKKLAQQTTEK